MKFNILDRNALYMESGELFVEQVTEQKEDEWGIKLTLKILENKFARENDDGELEYFSKENFKADFDVSGAWDIVRFSDDNFHIFYVGVKMNFCQNAINAFQRNEKKWYKLWVRNR